MTEAKERKSSLQKTDANIWRPMQVRIPRLEEWDQSDHSDKWVWILRPFIQGHREKWAGPWEIVRIMDEGVGSETRLDLNPSSASTSCVIQGKLIFLHVHFLSFTSGVIAPS